MPDEDSLHKNVQLPLHFEGRLSEDEQKRGIESKGQNQFRT